MGTTKARENDLRNAKKSYAEVRMTKNLSFSGLRVEYWKHLAAVATNELELLEKDCEVMVSYLTEAVFVEKAIVLKNGNKCTIR